MWEKKGKIWEIWSMTKRRSSEIFTEKNDNFFPKKLHSEILGPPKQFSVPNKLGARSPQLKTLSLGMKQIQIQAPQNWYSAQELGQF